MIKVAVIFAGCFFMIGFASTYHVPKIKKLILFKIDSFSARKLPVRIFSDNLSFTLWPVGAELRNVVITPNEATRIVIEPLTVRRVKVSLSGWGLLKGQLRVGRLLIDGTEVTVKVQPSGGKSAVTKLDWNALLQIPIDQISVGNIKLAVNIPAENFKATVGRAAMRLDNRDRSFRVRLLADEVKLAKDQTEIDFDASTQFLVDEEGVYFTAIRLRKQSSFLVATGTVLGDMSVFKLKNLRSKVRSQFNMSELTVLLRDILGQPKIPSLGGTTLVDGEIVYDFQTLPDAKLKLEATDLTVDRFGIGHVIVEGGLRSDNVYVDKFRVRNNGGVVSLEQTKLSAQKPYKFETVVVGSNIHIRNFLNELSIKNVPVETKAAVRFPCAGRIEPSIEVNCTGEIKDTWVKVNPNPQKPIVEFDNARAEGQFKITDKDVSYSATLAIGESKGKTDGVIEYKKGFKINYETERARFADFKQLVGFDFKGEVALKGSTEGNSKGATFGMDLASKDLWFEGYGVGNVKTELSYRKGVLTFRDVQGKFNQSHYNAQLRVFLDKKRLEVEGRAPFLALEDVQEILKNRVPLPVNIEGTGSAAFRVQGPFELSEMSATLDSSFYRGAISGDSFDQLHFAFDAINGNLKTDRIQLIKGSSQTNMRGTLSPLGILNANVITKNYQIDQSENFAKLKFNLAGTLNADANLTGPIKDPKIDVKGTLTNVLIGERAGPNSDFTFTWTRRQILGEANLIGKVIQTKFKFPFKDDEPYSFDIETQDWNFAQFFGVVTDQGRSITHTTSLTGSLHLEGPTRNLYSSSGDLRVEKLLIRNGPSYIENKEPLSLRMTSGKIATQNFSFAGETNFFKIVTHNTNLNELNLSIDGRIDLLLAQIVTPFLEDLRGTAAFNINVTGPVEKPAVVGSAFIQNGFVRLKAFPHPFEQVAADLFFSQQKLLINSVKGRLAGGLASASGQIQFLGAGNIPIEIRGLVQDAIFNVPEGMTTRGSGEFFIQGKTVPYVLGADFAVVSGSLEKKINATERKTVDVRPSPYLPKFLAAKRFSPIELNLNANIQNPLKVLLEMPQIQIAANVDGKINIKGAPDEPYLTGRLTLARSSRITIRNNNFQVTSGTVEYRESPPTNPEINVSAEGKVTVPRGADDEREYDVYTRFTGPAQNPEIHMSSQPPLAERELLSLVTLGYLSDVNPATGEPGTSDSEGDNAADQASATGMQITSSFINEQLGINRRLEKNFGVKFDYSSSYDSTDQANRHTFSLRKQWSPRFGTSASRSVGKTESNNVKADYKLDKNLSVIGHWEGTESNANQTAVEEEQPSQFGVDLEYRREFK